MSISEPTCVEEGETSILAFPLIELMLRVYVGIWITVFRSNISPCYFHPINSSAYVNTQFGDLLLLCFVLFFA